MLKYYVRGKLELQHRMRGAGILEYMLIAVVSLGAFLMIRAVFPDFINGLWEKISGKINGTDSINK